MKTGSSFCLARTFGTLLVLWPLLLLAFGVARAETAPPFNRITHIQGTVFTDSDEHYAPEASSSSLPSLSDVPQPEERLKLAGLQPGQYRASHENRQGPSLSENSPSPLTEGFSITSGAFNDAAAALLTGESSTHSTAGSFNRFSCTEAISPLRTDRITYNRALLAGIDGSMEVAPDPAEDQSCEKSDLPPDGDQMTGIVLKKDWPGLWRDTAYFFGYQFVIVGLLYVLPESVTQWSKEQKEDYTLSRWWRNVTNPVWDDDKWYINYLVHPYWGATYYIRARERGFDKLESFVYSAFLSALFEFGVEALFEPPSYQDLIITPIGGTLLGMYVFEPVRDNIKAKGPDQKWYDQLALILTDPLGALSDFTDKLLGVKSSVKITAPSPGKQKCKPVEGTSGSLDRIAAATSCRNSYTGFELTFKW